MRSAPVTTKFRAAKRLIAVPTLVAFVSSTLAPAGAWAAERAAPAPIEREDTTATSVRQTETSTPVQGAARELATEQPGARATLFNDTSGAAQLLAPDDPARLATGDDATGIAARLGSNAASSGSESLAPTTPTSASPTQTGGSTPMGATSISPQAISLPSGAATVAGMGESFSAQLTTGIAALNVPFALPQARGAAQPALGLVYASSGGYGSAGVGWSVSGPAFIARQSDRGVPKYDDRVDWHPEQDRFIFGGQELVPICLVGAGLECSGALRAASGIVSEDEIMPAWSPGWQYFRARVERSFLRFFWSPDHRTWRIQSKDGIQLELGMPLDDTGYSLGLETNPTRANEIYRWHLIRQYDPHGQTNLAAPRPNNAIVFRYSQDGGIAYLTDIFYTSPAAAPQTNDLSRFAHHVRLAYGLRPDPSLSFRAGFAQQARLRLERVDVTSKPFANAVASPRELVRRYHLSHDVTTHVSLLESGQMEGRCTESVREGSDGTLPTSSCPRLPKLTFGYKRVEGRGDVPRDSQGLAFERFNRDVKAIGNTPAYSLDARETSLFDVNADSLPDVLVTDPARFDGQHGLFLHGAGGDLAFSAARKMSVTGVTTVDAGVLRLGNPNVAGLDFDGNGIADLLHMPRVKKYSVFQPKLTGSTWSWAGREVTTASGLDAKIDFAQNARRTSVMDVNGDGLVDVVFASATEIQTFFALGRYPGGDGRFGHAQLTSPETASLSDDPVATCVPWSATPVRLGDDDVRVADMNADGLPDVVRVRSGQVFYWPGRGNGFWGTGERDDCAPGTFGQGRHVEMYNAPRFGVTQPGSLMLADVNGDGLADAVEVRFNAVDIYLNDNGAGWADRVALTAVPVTPSGRELVRLSDIDGSGTVDLVWGQGYEYNYVDLAGSARPHVLTKVENGLGKTVELEYSTSAKLMLEAARAGEPWTRVMPLVVPVVRRVTVRDNLEKLGRPAGAYVTEYDYRDPIFDGRQREFRGFSVADTRSVGDDSSPTSTTRSTFLLGECEVAQNGFDVCAPGDRWKDNWREALKGLPVLVETFDDAGSYLTTSHAGYRLVQLYVGRDGRRSTVAFTVQNEAFTYDSAEFDSAEQTITLDEVEVRLVGIEQDETRGVTRRAARGTARLRNTSRFDGFGSMLESTAFGCVEGCPAVDEAVTIHSETGRVPDDASGWLFRPRTSFVTGSGHAARRSEVRHEYDARGDLSRSFATLSGTLPLDRFHESVGAAVAPAPPTASGGVDSPVEIQTAEYVLDDFGNVREARGPLGRCRTTVLDGDYAELPVQEVVFGGALGSSGCGERAFVSRVGYDRGLKMVRDATSITNQPSRFEYDAFGRLVATYLAHPDQPGTLAALPSVKYEYLLPSDSSTAPYVIIVERHQDSAAVDVTEYHESYHYLDGLGRPLVTLSEADSSAGDGGAFIAGGLTDFTAKGALLRSYENRFWTGNPLAFPILEARTPRFTSQQYDAFGRPTRVFGLDGRLKLFTVYRALGVDAWDAADLDPGAHRGTYASARTDGHGRQREAVERVRSNSAIEERRTMSEYLPTGELLRLIQRRAGSPDIVRWLRYDSLGRKVLNVEPNTSQGFTPDPSTAPPAIRALRYAYDDAGQLVGTSDARGCGINYHRDTVGRLVGEDYSPCRAHHATYTPPDFNAVTGIEVLYRHDTMDPEASSVQDAAGRTLPIDASLLAGRTTSVSDLGSKTLVRYDARGRVTGTARRIAKPGPPASGLASRYAPRWYVKEQLLDAADRPLEMSTGASRPELVGMDGRSIVAYDYSARGLAVRTTSSYGTLLEANSVDANGLPIRLRFGDGAGTERSYVHDEQRRLRSVQTYRAVPALWSNEALGTPRAAEPTRQLLLEDYDLEYDAVNNVASITDWRTPQDWPQGAKPVTRRFEYDDLYRLTRSTYEYDGGNDTWTSPFAAENASSSGAASEPRPSPHVSFQRRVLEQRYEFDHLGNTRRTSDDANGFFDRSLGVISQGTPTAGPHQLRSASNRGIAPDARSRGDLDVGYDSAGNVADLIVRREGPCLPEGASCWQRYRYDWDEVGQLARARRFDLVGPERGQNGGLSTPLPSRAPDVDLRYAYTAEGTRVLKTSTDGAGNEQHTVFVFASLELRRSSFEGTGSTADYALSAANENVLLAGGVQARVVYAEEDLPTLTSGRRHVFLLLSDYLGSNTFVVDHETGELVEYSTYQAYGTTEIDYRPERWSSYREPYKFSGKEEDVEAGLAYFGARYLSLGLGRWLSADPVAVHQVRGDLNPYAYVAGRPLVAVDPNGQEIFTVIAIGIFVGALISASTNAVVQQATTGTIDWGWKGVGGAALSGAVAGGVGGGVGGVLGGGLIGISAAGTSAGAAGGATSAAVSGGGFGEIMAGAGIGALSGLAGSIAGYHTVDWGWFGSAIASSVSSTSVGVGSQALRGGLTSEEFGIALASGVGSGIASAATMRGFRSPPSDAVIEQIGGSNLYRLGDQTIEQLTPMIENWNFERSLLGEPPVNLDLRDVRIQFGETGGGDAYTLNGRITLDPGSWEARPASRVGLLVHELTHTIQQAQLGGGIIGLVRFLPRYIPEFARGYENYLVPDEFANPQLYQIDPLDPYFTLDQTANRVRFIYQQQYAP